MRCKPNDLALIVSNRFSGNIGSFVTVKKIAFVHGEHGAFWSFEKASKPLMLGGHGEDLLNYVTATATTEDNKAYLRDADLQPIRDYGLGRESIEKLVRVLDKVREEK